MIPVEEETEEAIGAPPWVVSFADMSLLLLSFFILLLSRTAQKTGNNEELLKIIASIKVGFGFKPVTEAKDAGEFAVLQVLAQQNSAGTASQINWTQLTLDEQPPRDKSLRSKHRSVVGKPVLFAEGTTEVDRQWQAELDRIAEIVRHHFRMIVIQGHCSPTEAESEADGGNSLSFRRAEAVKNAFLKRGLSAARLRLVICADLDTRREPAGEQQRRAVVTLGTYFLPK